MPLPEGYLPRRGDILMLLAKTRFDVRADDLSMGGEIDVHLQLLGDLSYKHFIVPLKDIERLWNRHWEVHDKVRLKSSNQALRRPGEILGIDGSMVWVKFIDAGEKFGTLHANQLESRPEEPDAEIEEPPSPPQIDEPEDSQTEKEIGS